MPNNFIELNRTFIPIPKDHTIDEEAYDFSHIFGVSGTKTWSDLLALPRVIILAEAGTGKTDEVKAAARRIHGEGKAAFFFRLEDLFSDFEIAFEETGTPAQFNAWLDSEALGWFFLDSVDESKLSDPKEFKRAIKRFAIKLGDQKHRAHIFITGRGSEWQAQSDLSFIKSTLPFIQKKEFTEEAGEESASALSQSFTSRTLPEDTREEKQVEPEIFTFCPLDCEQRKIFSQAYKVPDVDAFLTAIERAEATLFAGSPQGLLELIEYWEQYRKITNRAKLIEHSIQSKLIETDLDRSSQLPLNPKDARYGAEMLAAAVTFLRTSRILGLEKKPNPLIKAKAIDVQSVLSWEMKQIRALLQRPIFDTAIYGCVRFHHRRVREYLTAQWVNRLLLNDKSRRKIEGLFFKTLYGRRVLIPSMRPILSWLILLDDRIREKAIYIAPEICLEGGDPSELPIALRKHLLEKFCRHYAEQRRWGFSFDISDLRRFAHPDLGETINRLLENYRHHEEIRALLLRMVWQGEIEACAEIALGFALDDSNDSYTRRCSIRSVGVAGSGNQKEQLVGAVLSGVTITNRELLGEVISAFAPDPLSTQDVLTLIQRVDGIDEYSPDLQMELKEYCVRQCPQNELLLFCQGLLSLLKQEPVIERHYFEVSQKYVWLLSFAALAIERLVQTKNPDALEASALEIILLAQKAEHYGDYHSKDDTLSESVPKWPHLNHTFFWFDVRTKRGQMVEENKGPLTEFWQVNGDSHYWQFTKNDFEKIVTDIKLKSELDDQLVALSLSFQLYEAAGRGSVRRLALKKAVRGLVELEEKLHAFLNPRPKSEESKKYWYRINKQQKDREKKKLKIEKEWYEWLKANMHVLHNTDNVETGDFFKANDYLIRKLQKKQNNNNKWAQPHWEALIPQFGQDLAGAYRDGCIDYWRKYRPELRSEGLANPNSTPFPVIIGLSGLEIEAQFTSDWPNNLSGEEVKLACRYAVKELNGFSKWLRKLHTTFPDIVESVLLKEIEWEFSRYDENEQCHYVLSKVAYGADWLKPKISKQILSLLKSYKPKHDDTLDNALCIVLDSLGLDQATFVEIAKTKVRDNSSHARQVLWLVAWMRVDANSAMESLKTILENQRNVEEATQFSMSFIISLFGGGRVNIQYVYQDFIRSDILPSLFKLMHSHIRTSEDIDRAGAGDDSSGLRDDAQNARDSLFNLLSNIPGKQTYLAMMDLSAHADEQLKKEWYAISAKRRAEADAEDEPWRAENIAQFAKDAEHASQNHRELFKLLVSRLFDLKAELEDGKRSNASLLQRVQHENVLRNYIAGWLGEHNNKGWYSIAQEDELPDGTKPDIHINGSGFDGPVPIELKIAENWTGPVLFERLNNQLCGQYLRDIRSNCGIYLLVFLGKKNQKEKHWKHPKTGENLDYTTLLESLEREARDICTRDEKIESLEIIGINLSKRTCKK